MELKLETKIIVRYPKINNENWKSIIKVFFLNNEQFIMLEELSSSQFSLNLRLQFL